MSNINLGKIGITHKGEFDISTQYSQLDSVVYLGASYCAKQSVKGEYPNLSSKWIKTSEVYIPAQDTEPVSKPDLWIDTSEDSEQISFEVTTTTLPSNSDATVVKTVEEGKVTLNFGIPKGETIAVIDSTLTDSTKAAPASKVGELSTSINSLSSRISKIEETVKDDNNGNLTFSAAVIISDDNNGNLNIGGVV